MSDKIKHYPINVYDYYSAPLPLRHIGDQGGDEDWIIEGAVELADDMERIAERLAVCDYQRHDLPQGRVMFVTCHA